MVNAISRHLHGSKRKEIKIRPGYKPPEDMEVYITRTAEASRNRGNRGGVPGVEGLDDTKMGWEQELLSPQTRMRRRWRRPRRKPRSMAVHIEQMGTSKPLESNRKPKIRGQTDQTAPGRPRSLKSQGGAHPKEETPTSTRVETKGGEWR